MKEVTVWIPDERVPEFYQRFGEFMSESTSTIRSNAIGENRVPAWANEPGAVELARRVWDYLSPTGQTALGILIDGALRVPAEKFTPQDLVEELGHPNGVSGLAGVFGSAGRAVKKAGVPRYRLGDSDWHFVWDWDRTHYWMDPEVAAVFQEAISR